MIEHTGAVSVVGAPRNLPVAAETMSANNAKSENQQHFFGRESFEPWCRRFFFFFVCLLLGMVPLVEPSAPQKNLLI